MRKLGSRNLLCTPPVAQQHVLPQGSLPMTKVLTIAFQQWLHHRSARLGAALAYYSVFSMGPLLLIVTSVAGLLFGADAVRGRIIAEFRSLLGETGSKAVEAILAGASSPQSGRVAAAVGLVLLLVAAVGVVAQLKDALNTIWNVEDPRDASWGWYARTYIVSFAGVLALGFLLAVSLVISTGLAAITSLLGVSTEDALGLEAANFVVSLALLTALFAMLFKWFPDTDIAWRDVWFGAVLTALVFNLGKLVIGWYVGTQGLDSTYGAAASIVVLMLWVYYTAQIVLFGAEVTHAYATVRGSRRGDSPDARSTHNHALSQ
jgi:membrane protein